MMDVLQRSLTTFVSLLGMRLEVSTSGGITLKLHSFLGGGGVVVVVVVVVVELVSSPPPAEVSLAARFFLRGANYGQVYAYTVNRSLYKVKISTTHFLLEGHLLCHMPKAHIAILIV